MGVKLTIYSLFEFNIQIINMMNRSQNNNQSRNNQSRNNQSRNQSQSIDSGSSSNIRAQQNLDVRRRNIDRVFSELLNVSREYENSFRERSQIDANETERARHIGNEWQRRQMIAGRELRLAPIREDRARENIARASEREIERTRARMCALETEATNTIDRGMGRRNPNNSVSSSARSFNVPHMFPKSNNSNKNTKQ